MQPALHRPDGAALRWLIGLAALVVVLAGLKLAAPLLIPVALAVFVAVVTAPVFVWLDRRIPTGAALAVLGLALTALLIVGAVVITQSVQQLQGRLDVYQTGLSERTAALRSLLVGMGIQIEPQQLEQVLQPKMLIGLLGRTASTLTGLVAQLFLILMIVVFVWLELASLPGKLDAIAGDTTRGRLMTMVAAVRSYLGLKAVISLGTGLASGILCWIMGVDFPVLMGVLAFGLNFVPNIGSVMAGIPPVLIALILHGPGSALTVAVGYVVINVAFGNVIEPRVMGRQLGLSALVVILSLVFWGWLLGPVGMLLSVPLTMALRIALESDPDTRWIAVLLADRAPEPRSDLVQVDPDPGPDTPSAAGD